MRTDFMRMASVWVTVACLWAATPATTAEAQAPAPPPSSTPATPASASPPARVGGPDERPAYDSAGRRDPFVSLARTGTTPGTGGARPAGPRGLLIAELSVRGVVESRGRFLATVVGPDKRTYTLGNGDQLLDGTVKVISGEAVVFLQDVTDPLSTIKQREIRKTIRSTEENR